VASIRPGPAWRNDGRASELPQDQVLRNHNVGSTCNDASDGPRLVTLRRMTMSVATQWFSTLRTGFATRKRLSPGEAEPHALGIGLETHPSDMVVLDDLCFLAGLRLPGTRASGG
jgi:hypothetical protein